jgi:hypothetical protein
MSHGTRRIYQFAWRELEQLIGPMLCSCNQATLFVLPVWQCRRRYGYVGQRSYINYTTFRELGLLQSSLCWHITNHLLLQKAMLSQTSVKIQPFLPGHARTIVLLGVTEMSLFNSVLNLVPTFWRRKITEIFKNFQFLPQRKRSVFPWQRFDG